MRQLRWGVVGIGRFLQSTIAPAMASEPECELVAAVSRDPDRAATFAAAFDVAHTYTDLADMLADTEVDAVYIATPNALHAAQVIESARSGKHVLCEKPLAIDTASAAAAVEACAEAGVRLGVNFHNRHMPWVQDVRRLVADGIVGRVDLIEVEVGSGHRRYDNWRVDPAMSGLGSVHNVGVHALDFLRLILDAEATAVTAMFDTGAEDPSVEMLALLLLRFSNGTLVYCNCNESLLHPTNEITIHGSKGRIVGSGLTRSRNDGDLTLLIGEIETVTHYPAPDAHRRCLAAFTRAALDHSEPDPSGIDGLRSVELCEAIARSVREGREVVVDRAIVAGPGTGPVA